MKIAILSRYQNTINRGAESFATELCTALSKYFEVDLLVGKAADDWMAVVKGNYDLVIPLNGRFQALKMSIGRIFGGYKILITGQSGIGRDDWWNITVCRPDAFVALTKKAENWAKNRAIGVKIVRINNGVSLDRFSKDRKKIKTKLKKPIVLSVGALVEAKHHERTIKALEKIPNVSLLLVGEGPMKDDLSQLADKIIPGRFEFQNFSFELMPSVYASADLFVLPSWDHEAFGIVYIEAMASGLGVVAPDDETRREIIGTAGILVDVSDPDKYAAAIRSGLNQKWTERALDQAKKFSWDEIGSQYFKLIKEIVK